MDKLAYIKNFKFGITQIVQTLFYIFPLSFIIGNMAININLLLFLIFSLFLIKKKHFTFRFKNLYLFLIAFFLYLFLSTLIQYQAPGILNESTKGLTLENTPFFKSFILFRFLILIFVVDILFFNNILNLKKFLTSSLFCTTFVSLDIIFQYLVGFDLFGYKGSEETWFSGPFGEELIAGGYLQKFCFFSFFSIYELSKKKKISTLLLIFVIVLHATGILLAGNRMPMVLFMFGCGIIILFIKNLRLIMISSLIIFSSIFLLISKNDEMMKNRYSIFLYEFNKIFQPKVPKKVFPKIYNKNFATETEFVKNFENTYFENFYPKIYNENLSNLQFLRSTGHNKIYVTALNVSKMQPILGFGLKSFKVKCWSTFSAEELAANKIGAFNVGCSNHPHNYYLEILIEAGIIGLILIMFFFIIIFKKSFVYLCKYNSISDKNKYLLLPMIVIFCMEIWPIRTSGSFFTTYNASLIWLNIAILHALLFKREDELV